MITLDAKPENSTSSSPLNLSSEEEPKISFSELLKEVNPKKDDKVIQNGAMILALESDQKVVKENSKSIGKDTLLSLLKTDKKTTLKDSEPLELNPKITQNLSIKEVKTLIAGAKEYLKEKIVQSDGFKDTQIKELPKTLKGLSQLAQKIGIDVSKITIEEVQVKTTNRVEPKSTLKEEVKLQVQSDVKELKSTPKEQVALKEVKTKADDKNQAVQIVEDKKIEVPKQAVFLKETPLFKAQTPSEHTTEQLVASKQFKIEEKNPKTRADETLKLLLRGEKSTQINSIMTADFSVATAKVMATTATSEATKALESLLHGESSESSNNLKIDGLSTLKSDSFEVKLNEAKQMIKYLSSDVKTAIEDYKSPFTRVKVQLNPQKLGEIDLTIVQRGKNLHISLSSNSAAINTLSVNANELRVQLTNNGINNASLNFNSQDSSHSSAGQQEQHRQREQQAQDKYNYFGNEEHAEEILSSLEIVVPHYA
ncbi:MAG: flagellar hook-length control protein FliK [Epsilonproteobacteria bacterium]|nr:MAG: flagellar hook-length control protein FliK [Campylobacterota bacterium]